MKTTLLPLLLLIIPLANALCEDKEQGALIIEGIDTHEADQLARILQKKGYDLTRVSPEGTLEDITKATTTLQPCSDVFIAIIAHADTQPDWCFYLGNTCIHAEELNTALSTIPTCTKQLFLPLSYAATAHLPKLDVYAPSKEAAPLSFHTTFLSRFSHTPLLESYLQTKAHFLQRSTTIESPRLAACTPQEKMTPTKQEPLPQESPLPAYSELVYHPSITAPLPPTKDLLLTLPEPLSINIPSQPIINRELPNTDCEKQCSTLSLPAPQGAQLHPVEMLTITTATDCKTQGAFPALTNKKPCTNYYVTSRSIAKRTPTGSQLECCCRRIATAPTRKCTPDNFRGWTYQGFGIIKGQTDEVAFTP